MSNITFRLNTSAVRDEILNSDYMLEECRRIAQEQGNATYTRNGCHLLTFKGIQRCHAIAFPNTKENPG